MEKIASLILDKVKNLPVVKYLNPLMTFLNTGQVFKSPVCWIYLLLALGCLLLPFYYLYNVFETKILSFVGGMGIVGIFLLFSIIVVVGVFGCRYWMERSLNVCQLTNKDSEFVAIPVISNLIQHLGEWLGVTLAVIGSLTALFAMLFADEIPIPSFFCYGIMSVIMPIVAGFIIILVSRVIAELLRALASIANNTKKS